MAIGTQVRLKILNNPINVNNSVANKVEVKPKRIAPLDVVVQSSLNNVIPANFELIQILRYPKTDDENYKRINETYLNYGKIKIGNTEIVKDIDWAVITAEIWNGKPYKSWYLKQGLSLQVWLDDLTDHLVLRGYIIDKPPKDNITTKLEVFECDENDQVWINFGKPVLLHRLIFYDIFETDTSNDYWEPIVRDYGDTALVDAATTKALREQFYEIKIERTEWGTNALYVASALRKELIVYSKAQDMNAHIIDFGELKLGSDDGIRIDLTADSSVDWSRFKNRIIAEYSDV